MRWAPSASAPTSSTSTSRARASPSAPSRKAVGWSPGPRANASPPRCALHVATTTTHRGASCTGARRVRTREQPVVDPDVVARRLLATNEALRELQRPEASKARNLAEDALLRAAVERWLQVAVGASIDVADHVIASEGWTPPQSARAAFATLAAHGKLPVDLADRLAGAAALRNILVHQSVSLALAP